MNGWQTVTQEILHILSNPAWSGVSSICALIGIPLAILLARKSKARQKVHTPTKNIPILKKIPLVN